VAQKLVFYLLVLYSLFLDNSDTTNAMLYIYLPPGFPQLFLITHLPHTKGGFVQETFHTTKKGKSDFCKRQ